MTPSVGLFKSCPKPRASDISVFMPRFRPTADQILTACAKPERQMRKSRLASIGTAFAVLNPDMSARYIPGRKIVRGGETPHRTRLRSRVAQPSRSLLCLNAQSQRHAQNDLRNKPLTPAPRAGQRRDEDRQRRASRGDRSCASFDCDGLRSRRIVPQNPFAATENVLHPQEPLEDKNLP